MTNRTRSLSCRFCHTSGHVVLDCQNIDPEQWAIELARTKCHVSGCKTPVTHTVQRLWTVPGRAPFALQYCCEAHIPGSKRQSDTPTPFYRVERIERE